MMHGLIFRAFILLLALLWRPTKCRKEYSRHLRGPNESQPSFVRELWGGAIDLGYLADKGHNRREHNDVLPSTRKKYSTTFAQRQEGSDAANLPSWDRVVPVEGIATQSIQGNLRPRIVGGQKSELESFAMHLRWDENVNEWKFSGCGGTLISRCHVLTAAHCVTFPRKTLTEAVYINAWRPFHNNSDGILQKPHYISRILPNLTMVHKNYDHKNNFNDIAILTLETCTDDFGLMNVADPQFMHNFLADAATTTLVAGFGKTSKSGAREPDTLQSVEVQYIGGARCDKDFYPTKIKPDMYCAGFSRGGKDSCGGDSGGPSYVEDPVTFKKTQIGIVSWGISCAEKGFPGVYVSTAYHYEWIKEAVCHHSQVNTEMLQMCQK